MKLQHKWMILVLSGATNAIAVAMPSMAMSVLFSEISQDLGLSLVQVGVIWGIGSVSGIVTGFLGGSVVDRFGPRQMLIAGVILAGLSGALRGVSNSFAALLFTVILSGFIPPFINMSGMKNISLWFPGRQLGMGNGVLSMGMALGFLFGSFLSATVLSPWLGGWRNVMFFYGAFSALLCIPWLLTPTAPNTHPRAVSSSTKNLSHSIRHVLKVRDIWLLGLGLCGIGGCVQGTLGYLPLYLRGEGWSNIAADGALSSFHLMSLVFVLPISMLSDRLRSRKMLAMIMAAMTVGGVGLLAVSGGTAIVWPAVIIAGMIRDGFMGVFMAMVMETEGVGSQYAGTASGLIIAFSMLGGLLAAPIGNSLASISPALPFVFWAAIALAGIVSVSQSRRTPQGSIAVSIAE